MLPCNPGGHTAYQDTFVSEFLSILSMDFRMPLLSEACILLIYFSIYFIFHFHIFHTIYLFKTISNLCESFVLEL